MVGASEGVARDSRRKPENGRRWSVDDFEKIRGVPWEPHPEEKGGSELRSKVRLPAPPAEQTETRKGKSKFTMRTLGIKKI